MGKFIAVIAFTVACTSSLICSAQPSSPAVTGAWAGEEQYWSTRRSGDLAKYLALFDDAFTGWPCGAVRPQTKADLIAQGAGLVGPLAENDRVSLEDKAATATGDVVVVYYRARASVRAPDGKMVQDVHNFTHTWIRRMDGWHIIGGMCRDDVRAS